MSADLAATREALRREIGPPTDRDPAWQPMVSAAEVRALLDALDAADAAPAAVVAAVRAERDAEETRLGGDRARRDPMLGNYLGGLDVALKAAEKAAQPTTPGPRPSLVDREALLAEATRIHDVRYGNRHCDRKYLTSCRMMPDLIMEAGSRLRGEGAP